MGLPVARSHTTVVSRWLVMPMAAIRPTGTPLFSTASLSACIWLSSISPGSCSTQPALGYICLNSIPCEATGVPISSNTTARELAIITCAAYENADFRRIVATQYVAVPWDGHPYDRAMKNKNKMLTLCEGGNGVKTGYTKAAGRCLVSGALRQGMQLVCVVLNAPDMWNDSLRLLDNGFENFTMTTVLDSLEPVAEIPCAFSDQTVPVLPLWDAAVPLKMDENAEITLELPENLTSGVARGEVLGYAMIGIKEMEPVRVPLIAGETVQPPQKLSYAQALRRVLTHWYPAQHEQEERKTA